MRNTILFAALCSSFLVHAQTEVFQSSFPFSDGNRPTFVAAFENAEADAVEGWYKNQLKEVSKDVSNKKEVRAQGSRIPEVAPDTITVLCKAEQGKKSTRVQLHMAYKVNGEWIGNMSDSKLVEGAKRHAYMLAVRYKKELLQATLTNEQKTQERLVGELAGLVKEKGRADNSIEKNRAKGVEAAQAKIQAEADLKTNDAAVAAKHSQMSSTPTEAEAKAFQEMIHKGEKLKEKIEKEGKNSEEADKKVKDLEQEVKDNLAAQEAKQKAIDEQAKKVEDAKRALDEVK